jgi:predicted Zn finger-like uncharacterized protein
MLLTCPQCETIFRVDRLRLHPAGQPVHCMICDHIWTARLVNQWRPARHAEFCVISSQIPFAGDCGFDLRWVNNITYQRPRHSNRLFPRIDRGLSPGWSSHIAVD